MPTVTKMQMFEKIRQLSIISQGNLLYMMRIFNQQGIYRFMGNQCDCYNIEACVGNIHLFPVANAVLGKMQRDGLINIWGMYQGRYYVYEISELLKKITSEDYFQYVMNYDFYKNNFAQIQVMYEEQKISEEQYEHWVSCFYNSTAKQHFVAFKKLQKEKKANFTLGQKVQFYNSDRDRRVHREGTILKMNSTRAIVQEISFKGEWVQRWNCTYNSLNNRWSNEPAQFISNEPIKLIA